LLELSFADHEKLSNEGRSFDCSTCPVNVKKLRRCQEDREDFTFEQDKGPWPMYVNKGGEFYGFCPAKATWDPTVIELYRLMVIASSTGAMLEPGGLNDQPDWWVENLSWFAPRFEEMRWNARMIRIFGGKDNGSNRRHADKNPGRHK
jgi:hypothetical protein